MGNWFLRTGVVCLIIGMVFGMVMGKTEDFTFAPAHAHLNLAGGVLMMLTGLIYNSRPGLAPRLAPWHYAFSLAGAVLLPAGIYGSIARTPWAVPVVAIGSLVTFVAMLMLAWVVFRMKKAD